MSAALLAAFHRAASSVPAYGRLLLEHGVEPGAVVDRRTFLALAPILTRANVFDRFSIDQLCVGGAIPNLAGVCNDASQQRFGLDAEVREDGCRMWSFGIGELDRSLCYETPRTIDVRRAALKDSELARELFGDCNVVPTVLAFNEQRTMIEALDLDAHGYGRMTVSLLDQALPIPLLRYQTGDMVRLLDPSRVMLAMWRRGGGLSGPLPSAMLALAGREKDFGSTFADYAPGALLTS